MAGTGLMANSVNSQKVRKRAEHEEIAMRQIDDAHDAEDEIEPEPDQREIQAEQNSGQQAVGQHRHLLCHPGQGCG